MIYKSIEAVFKNGHFYPLTDFKFKENIKVIITVLDESETIEKKTPYELGKDLFGKYGSGKADLAQNRKNYLKEILNEKFGDH